MRARGSAGTGPLCCIFHTSNGPIGLQGRKEVAAGEGVVVLRIKVYYFSLPSINQLNGRRTKKEKANLIFVSAHKRKGAEYSLIPDLESNFLKVR